jgi:hypothetical protein
MQGGVTPGSPPFSSGAQVGRVRAPRHARVLGQAHGQREHRHAVRSLAPSGQADQVRCSRRAPNIGVGVGTHELANFQARGEAGRQAPLLGDRVSFLVLLISWHRPDCDVVPTVAILVGVPLGCCESGLTRECLALSYPLEKVEMFSGGDAINRDQGARQRLRGLLGVGGDRVPREEASGKERGDDIENKLLVGEFHGGTCSFELEA